MEQRGSITVFFSVIFLCIILIVVTMIDGAFLYVGHVQTERAVSAASYAMLSEYYIPLKEDYGIFAYDFNKATNDKVKGYITSQLNPYDVVNYNDYWNLYNFLISNVTAEQYDELIIPTVTEGQILEYMKYRAPISTIEPFLIKLEMVKKVASTSKVVKKKNEEVDKKAVDIDDSYQQLIKYIEGIREGQVSDTHFIKMLVTDTESYYTNIPDVTVINSLKSKLKSHSLTIEFAESLPNIHKKVQTIIELENKIDKINTKLKEYEDRTKPINSIDKKIDNKRYRIDDINKEIKKYEDELNITTEDDVIVTLVQKINKLKYEKNNIFEDIDKLKSELEKEKNKYFTNYNETYEDALRNVVSLTDEANMLKQDINQANNILINNYGLPIHSTYKQVLEYQQNKLETNYSFYANLLSANRNAINAIKVIKSESQDLKDRIYNINNDIENNIDEYDERTVKSLREDMDDLAKKLYDPDKDDQTTEDSIVRMEKIINTNIQCLDNLILSIEKTPNLQNYMIDNKLDDSSIRIYDSLIESCNRLNADYKTSINFKFGELKESPNKDIKEHMNEQIDKSEDTEIVESDYNTLGEDIINDLPSYVFEELLNNNELSIDDDGEFTSSFFDNLVKFDIVAMGEDIRNELYINEYVLSVFDDYLEYNQLKPERKYLNHQVEYVIGGANDDSKNCRIVQSEIMLIRSGLNFLHIITDKTKKAQAKSLAIAMSSWWSAGLATYIFELLIIGAWSIAESYIDIYKLKQGDEVAFYKSQADWNLGIESLYNFAIEKLEEVVIEQTINVIDRIAQNTQEIGSELLNRAGNVTTENAELFLDNAAQTMSDLAKQGLDELDYQVDRVIKESAEAIAKNEEMPNYNNLDEELVNSIQKAIQDKEDDIKKKGYTAIDNITTYALNESKEYINNKKDEIVAMAEEKMNEVIEEVTQQLKDKATDQIKKSLETIKKDFDSDIKDITQESKNLAKKKRANIFSSFKLSYQDYLRLLLLIQNNEQKIQRIQNLIQLDIMDKYDEDFRYENYATGIKVNASVYKKYILLDKIDVLDDDIIFYNASATNHY